jgi:hypothetical protein
LGCIDMTPTSLRPNDGGRRPRQDHPSIRPGHHTPNTACPGLTIRVWHHNLVADHYAIAEIAGRQIPVIAEEIPDGDTYDEIMRRADLVYAGFRSYRARITQRDIPVFLLRAA